jgi:hypothetical protein
MTSEDCADKANFTEGQICLVNNRARNNAERIQEANEREESRKTVRTVAWNKNVI